MSELDAFLGTLGLQEYSESLVSNGFKTWKDVMGISEDSLADVGFKLGHRRKLQREIASCEGKSHDQPLTPAPIEANMAEGNDTLQLSPEKGKMELNQSLRPKRKYRRRQPKDPHTPLYPKSDYVLFANHLRENPDVAKMSFVEISKWVGKQWEALLPDEKAMWSSFAAQQKNRYEIELAAYKKTEQYKEYQRLLRARKAVQHRVHDENILSGSQERIGFMGEQEHRPLPVENATNSNTRPLKAEFSRTEEVSSKCSDYGDNQDIDFTLYGESLIVASYDKNDTMPHQLISDPGDRNLGIEAVPVNPGNGPRHIQALNPFHMISCTSIRPYLESFLQGVNKHYYIIDPDMMLRQFNIAITPTTRLPNHSMCTLCICVSIGCQLHKEGSEEMAIMWYENGRRYLDSDDWGWSLNVMRAMALISIFHRNQRPTTAWHYLNIALQIGKANNLPIMTSGDILMKDTLSHEWVLLWNTIQTMAIGNNLFM